MRTCAVADVERDDEPLAERTAHGRRIGEGGGADDDAVGAGVEQGSRVLERADPAGGLQRGRGDRLGDEPDELRADAPGARAVEVDEVDARRARRREAPGQLDGVAGALDDLVVVPLMQADGALAEHVDGRDHLDRRVEPPCQHAAMLTC